MIRRVRTGLNLQQSRRSPCDRRRFNISNLFVVLMLVICTSISISYAEADGTTDRPAEGIIHGKTFIVENGTFKEGVLTLRQGKDFFPDIAITLFLDPRQKQELPSGKTITVTPKSPQSPSVPTVLIKWKDGQEKMPNSSEWFRREYAMTLAFGAESGNKLPGKINISLPDSMHSYLAGTFTVDIEGFKFNNGQPDLTTDSFTTFEYVAKEYLEKNNPNQSVKSIKHGGGIIKGNGPSGSIPFGYTDIGYQIGNGYPSIVRLQFVKDKGIWRIYNTLKINEIHQAHPFKIPGAQDEVSDQIEYQSAKNLEKEIQNKFPDKGIYDTDFNYGYNSSVKMGESGVRYSVGDKKEKCIKRYLMKLSDKGWKVDRELAENQSVNYKTGKVVSK